MGANVTAVLVTAPEPANFTGFANLGAFGFNYWRRRDFQVAVKTIAHALRGL